MAAAFDGEYSWLGREELLSSLRNKPNGAWHEACTGQRELDPDGVPSK